MTFLSGWSRRKRTSSHSFCVSGPMMYSFSSCSGVLCAAARPCTDTFTWRGLRRPARARASTSAPIVAENSPVRRCFGRRARIAFNDAWKPISRRRSASSRISTSSFFTTSSPTDCSVCSSLPGVPTMMLAPASSSSRVSTASEPPVSSRRDSLSTCCAITRATDMICIASSRVGAMIMAPTSRGRHGSSHRRSSSKTGMRKAAVLPEPVHACTATSLLLSSSGIVTC
mmetsp:Transcript_929/g.1974  ORF Transcript_929/g.1974 Transcript_929/m.1974 type:complete len:228 (-) Transcript_929:483-1166(-)